MKTILCLLVSVSVCLGEANALRMVILTPRQVLEKQNHNIDLGKWSRTSSSTYNEHACEIALFYITDFEQKSSSFYNTSTPTKDQYPVSSLLCFALLCFALCVCVCVCVCVKRVRWESWICGPEAIHILKL